MRYIVNAVIGGTKTSTKERGLFKEIEWPFELVVGDHFFPEGKVATVMKRWHRKVGVTASPTLLLEIHVNKREFTRLSLQKSWFAHADKALFDSRNRL